ncbi:hypothetical protein I317_03762 [Kwoniella heveanensis CBS 569]|uniref:Uncharacterized protein n=1 Tax=Kwoniella heveanensis BCC8398 TaxID=1296120 RepID=A0A1B9GUF5_9TREE|nr:hypothetical protein I316_03730 [Kwoniella heveanensis BCC8398]OCF42387.1 hypothetical protein I317_03762 [Kwoniella heveanensis CBS 569]
MPYISTETLIGAALLVVVALGYQYIPSSSGSSAQPNGSQAISKSQKKRAAKKKAKGVSASAGTSGASGTATPVSRIEESGSAASKQVTASGGEGKSKGQQPQKKKLLAERLLPKEPKTKVDDMLAPEDRPPSIARVMKVSSSSSSTPQINGKFAVLSEAPTTGNGHLEPAGSVPLEMSSSSSAGSSGEKVAKFENDYASSSEGDEKAPLPQTVTAPKKKADDGWSVVASKPKKSSTLNISSDPSRQSTSLPLPDATRIQKKNAKKAEAKKAARAAEEADRQRRLQMHKKDLERERINELYASKQSNPARGKALGGSGSAPSSKATVTANGKLVWD